MLAILRDQGLEKYVRKEVEPPTPVKPAEPTKEELEAAEKWKEGDARACTRIELSLGDSEMIHLSGTTTAKEMWNQLCIKLRQFDVKGAYLNGYLNETIYMNQPLGFEDGSRKVCLLK